MKKANTLSISCRVKLILLALGLASITFGGINPAFASGNYITKIDRILVQHDGFYVIYPIDPLPFQPACAGAVNYRVGMRINVQSTAADIAVIQSMLSVAMSAQAQNKNVRLNILSSCNSHFDTQDVGYIDILSN